MKWVDFPGISGILSSTEKALYVFNHVSKVNMKGVIKHATLNTTSKTNWRKKICETLKHDVNVLSGGIHSL